MPLASSARTTGTRPRKRQPPPPAAAAAAAAADPFALGPVGELERVLLMANEAEAEYQRAAVKAPEAHERRMHSLRLMAANLELQLRERQGAINNDDDDPLEDTRTPQSAGGSLPGSSSAHRAVRAQPVPHPPRNLESRSTTYASLSVPEPLESRLELQKRSGCRGLVSV